MDTAEISAEQQHITSLLAAWSHGDAQAATELTEIVYAQVRVIAEAQLRRLPGAPALQPTELAHELFVRLLGTSVDWKNRRHFYATVALAMRRLLVDAARARLSDKRGGELLHVTLSAADEVAVENTDAESLDAVLVALRGLDARKADIIEMTYLLGLEREEVAQALAISVPTVDRELRFARAWLKQRLAHGA